MRPVDAQGRSSRGPIEITFYALGDKRERGVALLRLKKLYRAAGLPIEGRELPDYLPAMLEFASFALDSSFEYRATIGQWFRHLITFQPETHTVHRWPVPSILAASRLRNELPRAGSSRGRLCST